MNTTLGELVKQAREARSKSGEPLSQDQLAELMDCSKQWISSIERGIRIPTLNLLVSLHDKLLGGKGAEAQLTLAIWLLAWVESHLKTEKKLFPNNRATNSRGLLVKRSKNVSSSCNISKMPVNVMRTEPIVKKGI